MTGNGIAGLDKTDNTILTNQPESVTIPFLILLRVVGTWRVVAETVFVEDQLAEVDESEIFVFGSDGDGRVKSAEAEAAMTPAV